MKKRYGNTTVTAFGSFDTRPTIEATAVVELGGADRYVEIQMHDVGAVTMEMDAAGRCKSIAMTHEARLHLSLDHALDLMHALGRALTAAERQRLGHTLSASDVAAIREVAA